MKSTKSHEVLILGGGGSGGQRTRSGWTIRRPSICRMTYGVVRNELRFGVRLYRWPGAGGAEISSSEGRVVQA